MELQTGRLIIIPCTKKALQTYSKANDFYVREHINMYLDKLAKDPSLIGWGVWLVIHKEMNKIIGDIGFKGKPNADNTVEVGYSIVPSCQNKGYATEAVKEIIQWAFFFENAEKITAVCLDDNAPSIRVLEKLQMKPIGHKDNMLYWELKKELI